MKVTVGAWAGAWGDSRMALDQLLNGAQVDYLVGDYLAEVTMALLARVRAKNPESGGYIEEAVELLVPALAEVRAREIKVVTNAGALNPAGAAQALREAIATAGLDLQVAAVIGDDLAMRVGELRDGGLGDMFTGEAIPEPVLTCNAYFGAFGIAEALAAGADIVITGRCVDSAMVLGPLVHEFGWNDDDHDLLSAGTLIGHLIECGPQAVGGLFSDLDQWVAGAPGR
jgi:Acyclic terpene utilisation family protein AtuA